MKKEYLTINIKKAISILFFVIFLAIGLEKFVFSSEIFNISRFLIEMIIILFSICLLYTLYIKGIEKKITSLINRVGLNKLFIVFSLIIGIVSALLTPLHEIPDEITHINFLYNERGLNIEFSDVNSNYLGTPTVMNNNKNKVKKSEYFDLSKKIKVSKIVGIPKLTIIRHFPQAIGMIIGEIFSLPVIIYLTICELCALIFYIFICNKALKKMPFKKDLMMFIMLLPVCVQQMASFSYDVMLNSFCFLFIASILDLKFSKKYITLKDLAKLLIYLIIIGICKIPYILLGILVFILPFDKLRIRFKAKEINYGIVKKIYKKHKIIYNTILCLSILVFCYILYKVLMKISIGRILIASLTNIPDTIQLYMRSIKLFFSYYLETIVGNLGIFNIKTTIFFEIYIYISLFFVTFSSHRKIDDKKDNDNFKFSKKDLIIIYLLVFLFIYIIILSMFEWTMYCMKIPNYNHLSMSELSYYIKAIPFIGGVQGRYFIPVIPLILIPMHSHKLSRQLSKLSPNIYQIIYYFLLFLYIMITLLTRFWI